MSVRQKARPRARGWLYGLNSQICVGHCIITQVHARNREIGMTHTIMQVATPTNKHTHTHTQTHTLAYPPVIEGAASASLSSPPHATRLDKEVAPSWSAHAAMACSLMHLFGRVCGCGRCFCRRRGPTSPPCCCFCFCCRCCCSSRV